MHVPIHPSCQKQNCAKAQQPPLHFQLQRLFLDFERLEKIIEIWEKGPDLDQEKLFQPHVKKEFYRRKKKKKDLEEKRS